MEEADARISVCRACPRLVAWREEVATVRKRAYAGQQYWGRPVPGFGSAEPRILIVGLAPSAHGANRTGRNFTGDRSGDWLYAALYRAGLASQPTSVAAGDGLRLLQTRVVGAVRCAPPGNLPTIAERDACRPWLSRQLALAWPTVRTVVALGASVGPPCGRRCGRPASKFRNGCRPSGTGRGSSWTVTGCCSAVTTSARRTRPPGD
jgi:uracil-DNA glycosylase family 4